MSEDASAVAALVDGLRPALRDKVAAALAYTRTVSEPRTPVHHGTEDKLWGAALDEAGLGVKLEGSWAERPIPLASSLSAEQRHVAEILARTPGPYLMKHAVPAAAWVRRQWLGIDPPGPLFRVRVDDVPLYHAVRAAMKRGGAAAAALLEGVPEDERTAALCDLRLSSLDAWSSPAEPLLQRALPDLGARAREWATAFADRLLALFAPAQPAAERGNMKGIPVDLARAAFVSLVRAGAPLERRWEELLPLEAWMTPEERRACVLAVPEERRDAAVWNAFGRVFFDNTRVALALEMLPDFPLPAVAKVVVAHIESARDTEQALAALRAAGAKDPAVAKIVKPLEAKLAKAPRLRVAKRIEPIRESDLDALRTKQLEAANAAYGGKRLKAAEIFAADEESGEIIMPSLTRLLLLVDDDGKAAYDAWLYMGDSGSIFKAGTTKRVASIIQGGLECSLLSLKIALKDALSGRGS